MKKTCNFIGLYILVIVIVLYAVFPFYYAIISSFKSGSELFRVDYFPFSWDFANYVSVFREQPFARNIFNSIIVSAAVVTL
jgi:trehalose/maltose transport system permease protein